MKRTKLKFYVILLSGVATFSACSVKNNMQNNNYTVTPNPLEVKGDTISITISANVPAKSINPKANIRFQPVLKGEKGEIQLKAVTIGGEKVTENVDIKVNSKNGGKITYTEKIPYNADLKRVTLYPTFAVNVKGNYQNLDLGKDVKSLAEGTITTPLLVSNTGGGMSYDVTPYVAVSSNRIINIYYPKDVDRFNPSFSVRGQFDNKKQIDSLRNALKNDKYWVVRGININAYASPDGELKRNEGLSKGRSNSSFNYFRKELKKLGFTEVNDENLKLGYTLSEDWAGFAKMVEASNHPEKAAVLNIVNNKSISDEEREGLIKRNHPKFWEMSKTQILPNLRRAELVVMGQTPLKSDDELRSFMSNLAALNDVELLRLGSISANLNDKLTIYNVFVQKYQNDWRGFNDLGAAQYLNGNKTEGKANIEKANTMSPENGIIMLNLANIARMEGDYVKAADLYKKASGKGADASYGLGVLAIKTGNYAEAVSQLNKSGAKDFNVALAQLLNGDANAAKATIDNIDPERLTWKAYYLRAIIGARTSNQDLMTTNLTRAVQLDANVRNMAKEDVEFIKFWSNPAFQTAIR
jgi:Tfp pilus assembly protein PilF/outer membrane protein OmpA-like peptidoglycan-associated protein